MKTAAGIKAGSLVYIDSRGLLRGGPVILNQHEIDALKLCAEIRDFIRHRWREETGQIPQGSPMASSWNEARYVARDIGTLTLKDFR